MTDYTPTTEEVRQDFAYPWEGFKQDKQGRLEAFDRWINRRDRKVKAKALRDAADAIERLARETTHVRVTEHVLVDVGAPGVLREYARLSRRNHDHPTTRPAPPHKGVAYARQHHLRGTRLKVGKPIHPRNHAEKDR